MKFMQTLYLINFYLLFN